MSTSIDSRSSTSVVPEQERWDDVFPEEPAQSSIGRRLRTWAWRTWTISLGTILCMSYLSSVIVVGWLMRWTEVRILRRWWKKSERSEHESFDELCESLGVVYRPHWLTVEQRTHFLERPTKNGKPPGVFTKLLRYVQVPWRSLWENLKTGSLTMLCIWIVTGWGCLITYFSWRFGWNNSFNKGYEQAFFGPVSGLIGSLLLILSLIYVPMARAHAAATGSFREFFNFRLIWRLIHARFTAYVLLAFWIALFSVPLEIMKTAPAFFDGYVPLWTNASDQLILVYLQQYFLACSVGLFLIIWIIAALSARLYAGSVLKALRKGTVLPEDLPPRLRRRLEHLDLIPESPDKRTGPITTIKRMTAWTYRRVLWVLLLVIWFGFIAKTYAGEFFHRHELAGFVNHPVIQLPCINHSPANHPDPLIEKDLPVK